MVKDIPHGIDLPHTYPSNKAGVPGPSHVKGMGTFEWGGAAGVCSPGSVTSSTWDPLPPHQPLRHPRPKLSILPCPLVARVFDGSKGGPNPRRSSLSPAPGIREAEPQPELTELGTFRKGSSQGTKPRQVPKSWGPGFSLPELW